MEKAKFSFAWVIAIIALIAYSYISFMGLVYCQYFPAIYCAILVALFDIIIIFLISLMSKARHSRWRRLGIIGQVLIGLIVLVMLLASSVAFSHFSRIISQKDEIRSTYSSAIEDAQNLGGKYDQYVEDRCQKYTASLQGLKAGSLEYNALFKNSISLQLSKDAVIEKCEQNLRKLLKGSNNTDDLLQKRELWLENESASIWNLNLPANIRDITSSVNRWLENYRELSSLSYTGEENTTTFEDASFNINIKKLDSICKNITLPSIWAILLALISYGLILLPWIVTSRNIASIGGDFDDVVEMPEDDD